MPEVGGPPCEQAATQLPSSTKGWSAGHDSTHVSPSAKGAASGHAATQVPSLSKVLAKAVMHELPEHASAMGTAAAQSAPPSNFAWSSGQTSSVGVASTHPAPKSASPAGQSGHGVAMTIWHRPVGQLLMSLWLGPRWSFTLYLPEFCGKPGRPGVGWARTESSRT